MSEARTWRAIAAVIAVAWNVGCTGVRCPSGTVEEQSGQCRAINSLLADGGQAGVPTAGTDATSTAGTSGSGGDATATGGGSAGTAGMGLGAAGFSQGGMTPTAGGSGGAAASVESCSAPGALRCSMQGAGNRDVCQDGVWIQGAACAAGETCVPDQSGIPSCVLVAELCKGNNGQTVCDAQGSLVVCKEDGSIESMMTCPSAKHCQAGIAAKTCATCVPQEEYRCTGTALEQCAPTGMTFMKLMDCETAGLCNTKLGKCSDAVCDAGKLACDGDMLTKCNAAGTAVEMTTPCAKGMCDPAGGDCNQCQPGTKKCEGDMVAICDPTGQTFTPTACPSGQKCVGLGQCVQCTENADCSSLNQGCKVGVCTKNACMAGNAPNNTACTASGNKPGRCSNGTCSCVPQCDGKECGDNGCSGDCGPCTGGQKCSSTFQCAQCLSSGDCKSSNPCQRATCDNGVCGLEPLDNVRCNSTGTCRNGTCCEPNCGNKCAGEADGCGGTCGDKCGGGTCKNGRCCNNSCTGLCGGQTNDCGNPCNAKCCTNSCAGKCGGQLNDCGNPCNAQCCSNSCTGKCGGALNDCGNPCSTPCSVCPANSYGCQPNGTGTPCWNCSRTIEAPGASLTPVYVVKCKSDGSGFTSVDICGVSDCSDKVETATCYGNDNPGHCGYVNPCNP